MIVSEDFNRFCKDHFKEAKHYADITIAGCVKANGPMNPKYDIEKVKDLGVISALEKAFVTFNANHSSNTKLSTYLSKLVHNDVLTELGKERTAVDRFEGFKRRKQAASELSKYSAIMPGVKGSGEDNVIFEAHEIMDIFGSKKGKEKQIKEMMRKFVQLPPMDQLVLTYWMNSEQDDRAYTDVGETPQRTYVQRILDELGWDESAANAVTIRCFKAKKKLKALMLGVPSDYENIYVPGSSNWKGYSSNAKACVRIYSDTQYDEIGKAIYKKIME